MKPKYLLNSNFPCYLRMLTHYIGSVMSFVTGIFMTLLKNLLGTTVSAEFGSNFEIHVYCQKQTNIGDVINKPGGETFK